MLYPPRDICSVNVPPDHPAFPGCGQAHIRPAGPDGLPVHPWGLQCEPCELWLRENDARWVPTIAEIKPTHDEARAAELAATRGSADRDDIMMRALAKIAGLEVPPAIGRPLPGPAAVTAMVACPGCQQAQVSGMAFCGHCGSPMRRPVPAAEIAPAGAPS